MRRARPDAAFRGAHRRWAAPRWGAARRLLLLLAMLGAAVATGEPAEPPPDAPDLPAAEVERGARGYGLTQGPEGIVRFEVEVLGRRAAGPVGPPPFLVRVSGGPASDTGVAAGMSGSPIYLGAPGEERLAGALAYAFPNSDHELALVTPIASMRALAEDRTEQAPTPPGPDVAPLLLSGMGRAGLVHVGEAFREVGLAPVPVQGGALPEGDPRLADWRLTPGAAVSVALMRGDLTLAAIGTVTDVRGGDVLAFGHPVTGRGALELALMPASVTAWIPNRRVPYKLAEPGSEVIGRAVRDGRAGLVARAGEGPSDLPLTVRVNAPGAARTFALRLARDARLSPALTAVAVETAMDLTRDRVAGGTAELAWQIDLADGSPVHVLDQVTSQDDLAREAARLAAGPLAVLLHNPFRDPELERVSLTVELDARRRDTEIVEVALESPEVAPGGTVTAYVRLQPFRGEAEVRTLRVDIPDDVSPGALTLTFRGASVPDPERPRTEPDVDRDRQATSGLPPVLSWAELIGALESRPQARELLAEIPGVNRPRRLAREDVGQVVRGLERVRVHVLEVDRDPAVDDAEEGTPREDGGAGGQNVPEGKGGEAP